jgi:hypothetical protein
VVDVFVRRATINWGVVALGCACIALLYGVRALPAALGKRFALLASLAPLVLVLLVIPLAYAYQDYLCSHLGQCVTPIPSGLPPLGHPLAALASGSPSESGSASASAEPSASARASATASASGSASRAASGSTGGTAAPPTGSAAPRPRLQYLG